LLLGSHARTQYVSSILFLQFWFENLGRSRSRTRNLLMDIPICCKAWQMDEWWVRMMDHCFGSQSSTGSICMYHRSKSWLRGPNSRQFCTFQIQGSAESGQNASTKSSWENSRKRRNKNPVGVRNQGVSRPQPKCFKVFKWMGELESRTCSLNF